MSILIKGIEMPKNRMCDGKDDIYMFKGYLIVHKDGRAEISVDCPTHSFADREIKRCPLVEVPTPHGDLIDKEPIKKFITDGINRGGQDSYGYDGVEILTKIEYATAIIEAEDEE